MSTQPASNLSPKTVKLALLAGGGVLLLLIASLTIAGLKNRNKQGGGPDSWKNEILDTKHIFGQFEEEPTELTQFEAENFPSSNIESPPALNSSSPTSGAALQGDFQNPDSLPPVLDDSGQSIALTQNSPQLETSPTAPQAKQSPQSQPTPEVAQVAPSKPSGNAATSLPEEPNPTEQAPSLPSETAPISPSLAATDGTSPSSTSSTTQPEAFASNTSQQPTLKSAPSGVQATAPQAKQPTTQPTSAPNHETSLAQVKPEQSPRKPLSATSPTNSTPPSPTKSSTASVTPEMIALSIPGNTQLLKRSRYYVSVEDFNYFLHAHAEPLRFPQDSNIALGTWTEAMAFTAWLTEQHRSSKLISSAEHYRLPKESESGADDIWKLKDQDMSAVQQRFGLVLSKGTQP